MAITLSDGTTSITLPDELSWSDEFGWSAVEQDKGRSLTGALIIQQGIKQKGRPISLEGGVTWAYRSAVEAVQDFYDTPDQTFVLDFHGRIFDVQFERPDGFSARPVYQIESPSAEHIYFITLKLFEVSL